MDPKFSRRRVVVLKSSDTKEKSVQKLENRLHSTALMSDDCPLNSKDSPMSKNIPLRYTRAFDFKNMAIDWRCAGG